MTKNKNIILLFIVVLSFVAFSFNVSAWWLNGTVYNTDGTAMNNATVSVEIYNSGGFQLVGTNTTY